MRPEASLLGGGGRDAAGAAGPAADFPPSFLPRGHLCCAAALLAALLIWHLLRLRRNPPLGRGPPQGGYFRGSPALSAAPPGKTHTTAVPAPAVAAAAAAASPGKPPIPAAAGPPPSVPARGGPRPAPAAVPVSQVLSPDLLHFGEGTPVDTAPSSSPGASGRPETVRLASGWQARRLSELPCSCEELTSSSSPLWPFPAHPPAHPSETPTSTPLHRRRPGGPLETPPPYPALEHALWGVKPFGGTPSEGVEESGPLGWLPAAVPSTVLGTLVQNGVFPDPHVGLNNDLIPDIFHAGRGFYTFVFCTSFTPPQVALPTLISLLPLLLVWHIVRGLKVVLVASTFD